MNRREFLLESLALALLTSCDSERILEQIKPTVDLDPLMILGQRMGTVPELFGDKHYLTSGGLEWSDAPWRLWSGGVMDFKGATLELDVSRVTDAMLTSGAPIHMIPSEIMWGYGKTGKALTDAIPQGMTVRNVTLVGNHSKLAPRAKALGVPLRISGAVLQGNGVLIDNVKLRDFGALGHEAFPLVATGVLNGYDQHACRLLPDGFMFTPATISNIDFDGYVPDASNDQVSIAMTVGGICPNEIVESPWEMRGPWRQIMRSDATLKNIRVRVSGNNLVQAGTIYQTLHGTIDGFDTNGASIGVYGDTFSTRGLHITANNRFMNGTWGVAFRLSPTGVANEQYSHEDYVIERFQSNANAGDVYLNADLPNTPTRYMRNFAVDAALSVIGDIPGIVRTKPAAIPQRGTATIRSR